MTEIQQPSTQFIVNFSIRVVTRCERVDKDMLEDQVTLSYSTYEDGERNVVGLEGIDLNKDPTTFYAIHCQLFNQTCDKL